MTSPRWPHRCLIQRKKILLISSTDPAIVPKALNQLTWLLKGLNVMLPLLVSRDTNPWELLCEGCLPIIPVTTARPLCPSPRNSLSTTCNVSQFFPCSLRPLLIHNLLSDAFSGVLVALRTIRQWGEWKIHQWVQEGKISLEGFHFK